MALATVAHVDAILGTSFAGSGTPTEARLVDLLALAQANIEDELGRPAEGGSSTETILDVDAPHLTTLLLPRWPIDQVNTVTEDGTALTAAYYTVDTTRGVIQRRTGIYPRPWAVGLAVVTVNYTPATIGRLRTLCASIAARTYNAQLASDNAKGKRVNGFKQLVIGRWSATTDSTDRSDPVATLALTEADLAVIRRFRDRAY